MPKYPINREFGFMLNDVARLLRTYADHKAAQFGITRAQWAVLVRLERTSTLPLNFEAAEEEMTLDNGWNQVESQAIIARDRPGAPSERGDDEKHPAESLLRIRLQHARRAHRGRRTLPGVRASPQSRHRGCGDEFQLGLGHRQRPEASRIQAGILMR